MCLNCGLLSSFRIPQSLLKLLETLKLNINRKIKKKKKVNLSQLFVFEFDFRFGEALNGNHGSGIAYLKIGFCGKSLVHARDNL